MNRFEFDAFLSEFGFLAEVFGARDAQDCDGIQVKRADQNLMDRTPDYSGADGSLVGIDDGENLAFVLDNGEIVQDAVKSSGYVVNNYAHQDNQSWDGETVLEAIYRLDCADTLQYIVSLEYGYKTRDHYSLENWRATIYKPAKSFAFTDIVDEAKKAALVKVKAAANF